jgi:predicted transcriptional regulator
MHARLAHTSPSTPMGSFGNHRTGCLLVAGKWYHSGTIRVMGMTLRLSEQQAEALRRQAAVEGRSMQVIALSAVDEYIARRAHKAKVAAALQRVVREEAGVLERLKDA